MHVAHMACSSSDADFGARDGAEISTRGEIIDIDMDEIVSANRTAEAQRDSWKNARQGGGVDGAGGLLGGGTTDDATVGL